MGLRRSHFSHQKQLKLSEPPSCPLPGACVSSRPAAGSGMDPMCTQLAQRGRMAEPYSQGCVYICHVYVDLTKTASKSDGNCVPWDFLAWIWPASPVRDQRTQEGEQELQ